MQLYAIRRRNAWKTPEELKATAERSAAEGDKTPDQVRWIRSYVVAEDDGDARHRLHLPGRQPRGDPRPRRAHAACRPTRSPRSPTR